jgi:hypothetical protein
VNRHDWRYATTLQDRAQVRGRASGVRCKAMLGGYGKMTGIWSAILTFIPMIKMTGI